MNAPLSPVEALVQEKAVLEARVAYLDAHTKRYDGYRRGFTWCTIRLRPFIDFRAGGHKPSELLVPEWLDAVIVEAMRGELTRQRARLLEVDALLAQASKAVTS